MKFKKTESGRSMVEMLGVLAIIGVLSVGGIAGYSLSMRRHRANGVVDIASKYALIAYNQCQQKILNNDTTDLTGCGSNEISFDDAGVGSLPAGVSAMGYHIEEDGSTEKYDVTRMYISFTDTKLCQAVASITGATCQGQWKEINDFKIKQN